MLEANTQFVVLRTVFLQSGEELAEMKHIRNQSGCLVGYLIAVCVSGAPAKADAPFERGPKNGKIGVEMRAKLEYNDHGYEKLIDVDPTKTISHVILL